jgi:tetratricopeptide (TPR) repeat protein
MSDLLRPLLMMFYAPSRGMAAARDRAALGQAALLALVLQALHTLYAQWPALTGTVAQFGAWAAVGVIFASAGSVLLVGLVFVPLAVMLSNLIERRGSVGLVLRQEYGAMAATTLYAVAAASLLALPLAYLARASGLEAVRDSLGPMIEMARGAGPQGLTPEQAGEVAAQLPGILALLAIQPLVLFGLWAVAAVRAVFRLAWWRSLAVVVASSFLMLLASPLLLFFSTVLASPFLLLLLFFMLRAYLGEAARAQRARASFRQNLEAATLNPADASAHYNLGLIHLQRKELEDARARFARAVEIDPEEVDAHYQLGRIAREQGRLPEAIGHFEQVVVRDQTHTQHEIWREIGATYVAAGQFEDAQEALGRFLDQRQSDPEGLYLMGRAQFGQGRLREAREWMQRCVEAVKTAPAYKYRADKRWLNEAQQFLRTQE